MVGAVRDGVDGGCWLVGLATMSEEGCLRGSALFFSAISAILNVGLLSVRAQWQIRDVTVSTSPVPSLFMTSNGEWEQDASPIDTSQLDTAAGFARIIRIAFGLRVAACIVALIIFWSTSKRGPTALRLRFHVLHVILLIASLFIPTRGFERGMLCDARVVGSARLVYPDLPDDVVAPFVTPCNAFSGTQPGAIVSFVMNEEPNEPFLNVVADGSRASWGYPSAVIGLAIASISSGVMRGIFDYGSFSVGRRKAADEWKDVKTSMSSVYEDIVKRR